MSPPAKGALLALAAAGLFGAGAPLAKLVLPGFSPLALAALLYLGAGLALTVVRLFAPTQRVQREAPVRRGDLFALVGIIGTGGVLGPLLMLIGLSRLSALSGSLLLNLEAPLTALLAVWIFREHLGGRGLASLAFIVLGAALLAYRPDELGSDVMGAASIAGACLCWAIDNNLTQRLSVRDPIALARIKTLGAGSCSLVLALALATGQRFSADLTVLLGALVLGVFAYGLSIVLATHALRMLGAAREAALFATGPFVGALLAIPLLGDRPRLTDAAAGLLMAAGVALLLTERHSHGHAHEALEHEHAHVHDEHHQHEHVGSVAEPHAHSHRHEPLTHEHPHVSDVHHRHVHKARDP